MKTKKLLDLADELENNLSLDTFRFGMYYVENNYKPRGEVGFRCNTAGCAIGHLAAKGKDGWDIENERIVYRDEEGLHSFNEIDSASDYFDIPRWLVRFLFVANNHHGEKVYDALEFNKTDGETPPKHVAQNIRRAVELEHNNQIEDLKSKLESPL